MFIYYYIYTILGVKICNLLKNVLIVKFILIYMYCIHKAKLSEK